MLEIGWFVFFGNNCVYIHGDKPRPAAIFFANSCATQDVIWEDTRPAWIAWSYTCVMCWKCSFCIAARSFMGAWRDQWCFWTYHGKGMSGTHTFYTSCMHVHLHAGVLKSSDLPILVWLCVACSCMICAQLADVQLAWHARFFEHHYMYNMHVWPP